MKNIYQLYYDNGCKCPFTVIRFGWGNTAFVVESIGDNIYGILSGNPPYYDNASVNGYYVNQKTGKQIVDKQSTGKLSCSGSYQWQKVEPI